MQSITKFLASLWENFQEQQGKLAEAGIFPDVWM